MTELLATAGFDWLALDAEHAPNDLRSILAQLQAVAPYPVHPVVRIPSGDATTDALKQSFKRAVRRAGIAGLRLHDLRHEATSRFFEKGLNVMEVASVTGHKTLQMLKRYTHLSVTDLATRLG